MTDNGKTAMAGGKLASGWRWEQVLHGIAPPLISPLEQAGQAEPVGVAQLR
jgi:hypothetical protein